MKAIITAKSELRFSDLTREYTFNLVEGNETILSSQVVRERPAEIVAKIEALVAEYQSVFEDENDIDVGTEIG